jgi:mediator of RNA polymerase II transcription subunit 14
MQNGKHAAPNGHPTHPAATSPTAHSTTKSVKLVLRPKAISKPSLPHSNEPAAPARPPTPIEVLEKELPPKSAFEDQIPLADIVDRLVQDAYSKLVELSDTYASSQLGHAFVFHRPPGSYSSLAVVCNSLPGTPLEARAKEIEHYATETRKKFLKAYVLSKWAKSADDVETSMVCCGLSKRISVI